MEIELYQIDTDLDCDGVCFCPYESLENVQGTNAIDSSIYIKVFSGETGCEKLEDVFTLFNISPPVDHKGRSLSVSDVIAAKENDDTKYYYCDSYGFKEINFTPEETRESHITVVICEPDKIARVAVIGTELNDLQRVVGGPIEAYYPFPEGVCVVCNDEGKLIGLPLSRAIKRDDKVIEIIAGTFFICGCDKPYFSSLTKEQQDRYLQQFRYPELFFKSNQEILAIPYNPKIKDIGER